MMNGPCSGVVNVAATSFNFQPEAWNENKINLKNFPDFVLQIFQRLLKRIALNKEPPKTTCQWDGTRWTRRWIHKRVWFLKQRLVFTLLRFALRNVLFCFI